MGVFEVRQVAVFFDLLSEISGSHDDEYEDNCLLGCCIV
jgi:hypothetical protein